MASKKDTNLKNDCLYILAVKMSMNKNVEKKYFNNLIQKKNELLENDLTQICSKTNSMVTECSILKIFKTWYLFCYHECQYNGGYLTTFRTYKNYYAYTACCLLKKIFFGKNWNFCQRETFFTASNKSD